MHRLGLDPGCDVGELEVDAASSQVERPAPGGAASKAWAAVMRTR